MPRAGNNVLLRDFGHGTAYRTASGQRRPTINRRHWNVEFHLALFSRRWSLHQMHATWSVDRNTKADAAPMSTVLEVL